MPAQKLRDCDSRADDPSENQTPSDCALAPMIPTKERSCCRWNGDYRWPKQRLSSAIVHRRQAASKTASLLIDREICHLNCQGRRCSEFSKRIPAIRRRNSIDRDLNRGFPPQILTLLLINLPATIELSKFLLKLQIATHSVEKRKSKETEPELKEENKNYTYEVNVCECVFENFLQVKATPKTVFNKRRRNRFLRKLERNSL